MTVPPGIPGNDPAQPPSDPAISAGSEGLPATSADGTVLPTVAASSPKRRRGVILGVGVLAVGAVGGGAALAASYLTGDGPDPAKAVPASAIGYVGLDADPSSEQKKDYLSLVEKFPGTRSSLDSWKDPVKALFDQGAKSSDGRWSYAADVQPWLGKSAALALLPPKGENEVVPLLVLAVSDQEKAKASLPKVLEDLSCEVPDDFAICGEEKSTVTQAIANAKSSPLSEVQNFKDDMSSLGDIGIVNGWADLAAIQKALPESLASAPLDGGLGGSLGTDLPDLTQLAQGNQNLAGRFAFTVRFDGPNVEMTGVTAGMPKIATDLKVVDADALPSNAVAALGLGGADSIIATTYEQLRKTFEGTGAGEFTAQVEQLQQQLGIQIPKDLEAAVGDQFSVVAGLDGVTPWAAVRVTGDEAAVDRVSNAISSQLNGSGITLAKAKANSATVLSTEQRYADEVAQGSGLADVQSFKDAVPDAKNAQGIVYVDVAKIVATYGGELPEDVRANLEPLVAVGMSARQEGDRSTATLRITTK
ncbi:MAG: DUF3352 domain-containing protein [Actinomycetota bacterium]